MSKPYSRKSKQSSEKLTAEFTSGELVIGICVALFIAVACFLAGVLIGRFERAPGQEQYASDLPVEELTGALAPDTPQGVTPTEPARQGVQTSPVSPARSTQQTYTNPAERTGPRSMEVAPPPPGGSAQQFAPMRENRIDDPRQESTTEPASSSPSPTTTPSPVVQEADVVENAVADARDPVTTVSGTQGATAPTTNSTTVSNTAGSTANGSGTPSTPATPPATQQQPTQTPTSTSAMLTPIDPGDGRWCVQLANLKGNNRQSRAEAFSRELRTKHNIAADVIATNNGSAYLVAVTGYRDRAAALNALQEIRKLPDLSEAFIKELP